MFNVCVTGFYNLVKLTYKTNNHREGDNDDDNRGNSHLSKSWKTDLNIHFRCLVQCLVYSSSLIDGCQMSKYLEHKPKINKAKRSCSKRDKFHDLENIQVIWKSYLRYWYSVGKYVIITQRSLTFFPERWHWLDKNFV